jgi:hypothetical protein
MLNCSFLSEKSSKESGEIRAVVKRFKMLGKKFLNRRNMVLFLVSGTQSVVNAAPTRHTDPYSQKVPLAPK